MTTRRPSVRFAALGLAMSGLLALGACGGDDSDDNPTTTAPVETVADDTTDEPADDTTTTDDSTSTDEPAGVDAEPAEDGADEGASGVAALSAEECQSLLQDFAKLGVAGTGQPVEDLDGTLDALSEALPDELQGDFDVLQEGYAVLQGLSDEVRSDPTNPEFLEAVQELATPEFLEASTNVGNFFENCQADLG